MSSQCETGQVTRLLNGMCQGDVAARDEIWRLLSDELHGLARRALFHERPGPTLQPTMLVNEAWLRLSGADNISIQNRAHFLALAARAIRQYLIDHARKRKSMGHRVMLEDVAESKPRKEPLDSEALETELSELARVNERQARVFELRFYGGMKVEETALVLGVCERTVKEEWRVASAWLRARLSRSG